MNLRLAGTVSNSIVDGWGLRYVVFVQGCNHRCSGCHNKHTWDFEDGFEREVDNLFEDIKSDKLLDGVTFSGGEPFEQAEGLAVLAEKIKPLGLDIIVYTGYVWEDLIEKSANDKNISKLLNSVDYVVDGRFEESLQDYGLEFRGSSNQRIIYVKASLESNKLTEYSEVEFCAIK
ncbi:MAG: anaerobic ribonucleoside-triphosphate reductase activating protein [Oscillospiraceae bacterium]|jgi:anaerobic ribonucleoside-triphosphate reductase activating protein|nr:anaerobic ribonucleoside-triphosphate reductase activating protein [Oscillospiraceae bacterium]